MAKATKTDVKTAVKSVKTPVKTAPTSPKELREMDVAALAAALVEVKNDLADARRSLAAGELVNPQVINRYRKQIARIKTITIQNAKTTTVKEDA